MWLLVGCPQVRSAFARMGHHMTEAQMDSVMADMDSGKDGSVSMNEFVAYWRTEIKDVADDVDDDANWVQIQVPGNLGPGEVMPWKLEDGRTLQVQIPEGLGPGEVFEAWAGDEEEEGYEQHDSPTGALPPGWTVRVAQAGCTRHESPWCDWSCVVLSR